MRARENVVDAVTEALLLRILAGELVPDAKLPSVRSLAESFSVNVSTVQRVLARLEEMRVVRTVPRSGVVVLDPQRHGGTALWPIVLRHAERHEELACAVLSDALAARRTLALEVVEALSHMPPTRYADALTQRIDALARVVNERPHDLAAIAESENEIVRTLLLVSERPAVLAIFNDITATLMASDLVLSALCGDTEGVVPAWRAFAALLTHSCGAPLAHTVEPLLAERDRAVATRFSAQLRARRALPRQLATSQEHARIPRRQNGTRRHA